MSDLCILFGRPHHAPDADDRFELEVLAAEELGIESYALPSTRSWTASRSARCVACLGREVGAGSIADGC
jgi:hypothetical protein